MHGTQTGQEFPLRPTDVEVPFPFLGPGRDPRLGDVINHLRYSSLDTHGVVATVLNPGLMVDTTAMSVSSFESNSYN